MRVRGKWSGARSAPESGAYSGTVEIHRSRGAPLNDYNVDEQKNTFFSSSYASVTLRGILQKNIDEASKKNNFQKKFIEKYLFFEEIGHFQEQKSATFSQKSG